MTEEVIVLKGVSKTFESFSINKLNFSVKKGYITGLIGPNGSGKTTTIRMIMGLLKNNRGSIHIFGEELEGSEERIKERIGFVCPENSYYDHLSVKQTGRLVAPFYKRWDNDQFLYYINRFELPLHSKVSQLSTGMKMKLSLSIALSHHADLILLDEPTSGLDPLVRREVLDILSDIIQNEDKTILFSTHILNDLERVADYIVCLNKGQLAYSGSKEQLQDEFKLIRGPSGLLDAELRDLFVHLKETDIGFQGLSKEHQTFTELFGDKVLIESASVEDIMVYTLKGEAHASTTEERVFSK
ncbi:ABC transporter, ATP-binding protein [Alkalibacterium sp. AK22]|uniref:phenol-soluble modulin export ABC transporter ATP-binding protein PmtA n=1 Tax=Alkalibacterium sp. AK22 TaxID=1229520 RepID=UPI0004515C45|nr:ABC transporter ATP-binding protein [Alkalibacterium sp. AK22]EXJ23860.1 ABC transporter, ATP-binding protein [Alkalibacterium sp. AK22]